MLSSHIFRQEMKKRLPLVEPSTHLHLDSTTSYERLFKRARCEGQLEPVTATISNARPSVHSFRPLPSWMHQSAPGCPIPSHPPSIPPFVLLRSDAPCTYPKRICGNAERAIASLTDLGPERLVENYRRDKFARSPRRTRDTYLATLLRFHMALDLVLPKNPHQSVAFGMAVALMDCVLFVRFCFRCICGWRGHVGS